MVRSTASRLSLAIFSVGLICFSTTILFYESYNPLVFNRWSPTWVAVILVSWAMTLFSLAYNFVRVHKTAFSDAFALFFVAGGIWAATYSIECVFIKDIKRIANFTEWQPFHAVTVLGVILEGIVIVLLVAACFLFAFILIRRFDASKRRVLARLLLLMAAPAFALAFVEGGLRVRNVIYPHAQGILTPSWAIFTYRYYKLNSLGFRDAEPRVAKPSNLTRIICIGDSYTEGQGIKRTENLFTEVIEAELEKQIVGQRFEVINAGRGGTHTEDHIATLRSMIQYQPDVVVLVYVFNDIQHVQTPLIQSGINPAVRFFFRLLLKNSHLGAELIVRARSLGFFEFTTGKRDAYFDDQVMSAHIDVLKEFFQVCENNGIPATLAPFDYPLENTMQAKARFHRRYKILCEMAANNGIQVWHLDHLFDDIPFDEIKVSATDGHPNERAHDLFGRELARRLRLMFTDD